MAKKVSLTLLWTLMILRMIVPHCSTNQVKLVFTLRVLGNVQKRD